MKLSYVKTKEIFFIFIGLSLLFLSFKNTKKIEFNLPYLSEYMILSGKDNVFLIFTHPLIILLLLCVLDIIIGSMIIAFDVFFVKKNESLEDKLTDFIANKLPIFSILLVLFFDESGIYKKDVYDPLKQFILVFISGGLLCVSLFGGKGFAFLAFLIYILILISHRCSNNFLVLAYLLSEIIYGLPYLIFIPHAVYLFGLYGAILGCLTIFLINYLILRKDLITEKKTHHYVIFATAYLIIVPISTYFGGIVGTIVSCIIIYTFYVLIGIENDKGLPQECIKFSKLFYKVGIHASG